MGILVKHSDNVIDKFEKVITDNFPMVEAPLKHTLTKDQYIREIFMPAYTESEDGELLQTIVVSKIHKTEHPFFILKGKALTYSENDGFQELAAPYHGITKPHTRRVLLIEEDCVWITVHSRFTNETIDQIEERIIEKHDNPLLDEEIKKKFLSLSRNGLDKVNYNNQNYQQ